MFSKDFPLFILNMLSIYKYSQILISLSLFSIRHSDSKRLILYRNTIKMKLNFCLIYFLFITPVYKLYFFNRHFVKTNSFVRMFSVELTITANFTKTIFIKIGAGVIGNNNLPNLLEIRGSICICYRSH